MNVHEHARKRYAEAVDSLYTSILTDLRDEVRRKQVLFVLGAGVSIMASGNAPTASWRGLLLDGVKRVQDLSRASDETTKRIRDQIDSADLTEMLGAATYVAQKLGAPGDGEFRRWLRESVGQLTPKHPELIEAIAATQCAILTTNYDCVPEKVTGRSAVTWEDIDRCEQVLRGDDSAIIHIHGHWESPETVILGQDTYALIANNERVQAFLRAAHFGKTFVYVGCGDGLSDPNFSRFFRWCERFFPDSQTRRYRLAREAETAALQQAHPPGQRVQVVSYGADYSDLVPFLESLLESPSRSTSSHKQPQHKLSPNRPPSPRFELRGIDWYEESDAAYLHGRAGDVERVKQLLVAHSVVRLPAPSGIGKSSLLRAGIVPALRQLGWRAVVIRPYDDPARNLPGEITRGLLDATSEPLTSPLDAYALRQQLAPLLSAESCSCLVLLIDQVEDVLSLSATPDAKTWLRDFLREIHRCSDVMPMVRAVVSYRTDAEAQLGPLWQQASSHPAGFPYHTLSGISPEDAEAVISEVAERLDWKLEITPRELAGQLRIESRSALQETSIFPPYLQILLSTVSASEDKTVTSAFIHQLGGVQGILATYLRRQATELEKRGGDYLRIRSVLQAVCRSSGEKLRQTSGEIADYTRLPEATVRLLLAELVQRRLVRPLGGNSYEIQHDRLAEVIIAELDPLEREFKVANELLLSKAASFKNTKALLSEGELEMLFVHREKLATRGSSERLLVASVLAVYQHLTMPPVGWCWLQSKSLSEVIESMHEAGYALRSSVRKTLSAALANGGELDLDFLIRVADLNLCKLGDGALEAIKAWSVPTDASKLLQLLQHGEAKVRRMAALSPVHRGESKSRDVLRRLAKDDPDSSVRRTALESLSINLTAADVSTLRQVAAVSSGDLAKRAVELLATMPNRQINAALRFLVAKAKSGTIRANSARILLRQASEVSATTKLITGTADWRLKVALADEFVSLDALQSLARDRAESVRRAALHRISHLGTIEAYDWLTSAFRLGWTKSPATILEAISQTGRKEAFAFLCDVAMEADSSLQGPALGAIANLGSVESVNFFLEQATLWKPAVDDAKEPEAPDHYASLRDARKQPPPNPFNEYSAKAIRAIKSRDILPELRGWSQSPVSLVRHAAIRTYVRLSTLGERTWMWEVIAKVDEALASEILEGLNGYIMTEPTPLLAAFQHTGHHSYYYSREALEGFVLGQRDERSLPALRDLCVKAASSLRRLAIRALANFADDADRAFLIAVARDTEDDCRRSAISALCRFNHPEALSTLREITMDDHDDDRHEAAAAFSLNASLSERNELLEECARRGRFDVAGVLDFHLHAPPWWPGVPAVR